MSITLDGTNGITTPDLESTGPVTGTTGTFSGAVTGTTGTFSGLIQAAAAGVRFNDTTIQTTAAVTAAPPTTYAAIGTYAVGRPQNWTNYPINSVLAGTSIYNTRFDQAYQYCSEGSGWAGGPAVSLINTGSWRCLGLCYGDGNFGYPGLWIRYA